MAPFYFIPFSNVSIFTLVKPGTRYQIAIYKADHVTCFSHCDSDRQSPVQPVNREPADVKKTASSDEPLIGPTAELHSSFSDELNTGSHQLDVDPTVLHHVNVDAE